MVGQSVVSDQAPRCCPLQMGTLYQKYHAFPWRILSTSCVAGTALGSRDNLIEQMRPEFCSEADILLGGDRPYTLNIIGVSQCLLTSSSKICPLTFQEAPPTLPWSLPAVLPTLLESLSFSILPGKMEMAVIRMNRKLVVLACVQACEEHAGILGPTPEILTLAL